MTTLASHAPVDRVPSWVKGQLRVIEQDSDILSQHLHVEGTNKAEIYLLFIFIHLQIILQGLELRYDYGTYMLSGPSNS